jgi:hypothetical protein
VEESEEMLEKYGLKFILVLEQARIGDRRNFEKLPKSGANIPR